MSQIKQFFAIFIISTLCCFKNSYAQMEPLPPLEIDAQNTMQKNPGKVECNEELKRCVYIVQNVTARELLTKINAIAFPKGMLSLSEGIISIESIKKLVFYIYDKDLLAKVIGLIPILDTFEDFEPTDLVLVTTEIFSLSEGALTEIQAQITSSTDNPAEEIANWVVKSVVGSGAGMGVKIGTNLLSSILGSKKVKSESSKITTIYNPVSNLTAIKHNQTTSIYISPTNGTVKTEVAGITIDGVVSIAARNSNLVLIKDYNLKYGVLVNGVDNPSARVNVLEISNPELYLTKGVSSILTSSLTIESSNQNEISGVSYGKQKNVLRNKLMVITRAEAISYENYVRDLDKIVKSKLYPQFSEQEISKFPTDEVDMEKVLGDIMPYAFFTNSGDRVLGFKINPNLARKTNIKKNIKVSVRLGSIFSKKKTITIPLESLMISGYKFDDLSMKRLEQNLVNIKLTLEVLNGKEKVTRKLTYNPETNKFIE